MRTFSRLVGGARVDNIQLEELGNRHLHPATLYTVWADNFAVGQLFTGRKCNSNIISAALRELRRARQSIQAYPSPFTALPSTATIVVDHAKGQVSDLERCLQSLRHQNRPPDQIIVLDRSSNGASVKVAADSAGAEYLSAVSAGPCLGKNASIRAAVGDIIAFVEDTLVFQPSWLQRLIEAFDSGQIMAVTGLELPLGFGMEPQGVAGSRQVTRIFRRKDFSPEVIASIERSGAPIWEAGAGSSIAFRKDVFNVISFDEDLDHQTSEIAGTCDLWFRVASAGGTCRVEPTAVAIRDVQHVRRQVQAQVSGYVIALLSSPRVQRANSLKLRLPIVLAGRYVRKLRSRLAGATLSNLMVYDELLGFIRGVFARVAPWNRLGTRGADSVSFEPPPIIFGDAPLISVVIPAYNAAATIDATLRSIRFQTYKNLEILVVDDGSVDQTSEIVERHSRVDARVKLIRQNNRGLAAARNSAISLSNGELIAPVDADDLCHPEKLARQVSAFQKAGSMCGLVYGWSVTIDGTDNIQAEAWPYFFEGYVVRQLLAHNFIGNGSSPLMTRAAVVECGGYDTTLKEVGAERCEDLKLYLAIAERYDFAVVAAPLTGYRVTDGNLSSDINKMIRSHQIVVGEYARRYPEYRSDIRSGHITLAAHFVVRALHDRQFRIGLKALTGAMLYAPSTSVWVLSAFVISHLRRSVAAKFKRLQAQQGTPSKFPLVEDCTDVPAPERSQDL
ncbi:glycosyltransferase [Microvirga terrae]|uniref:Glycosyltransferase n=1 Tax=Microvirga terrae TaxID=2740529 RepID=A0ABY5RQ23_9HYPH|nr:glycosyltransferase [Microvirga terrae]UVF18426.1 glycosyltransferase [Microvirga terrae]